MLCELGQDTQHRAGRTALQQVRQMTINIQALNLKLVRAASPKTSASHVSASTATGGKLVTSESSLAATALAPIPFVDTTTTKSHAGSSISGLTSSASHILSTSKPKVSTSKTTSTRIPTYPPPSPPIQSLLPSMRPSSLPQNSVFIFAFIILIGLSASLVMWRLFITRWLVARERRRQMELHSMTYSSADSSYCRSSDPYPYKYDYSIYARSKPQSDYTDEQRRYSWEKQEASWPSSSTSNLCSLSATSTPRTGSPSKASEKFARPEQPYRDDNDDDDNDDDVNDEENQADGEDEKRRRRGHGQNRRSPDEERRRRRRQKGPSEPQLSRRQGAAAGGERGGRREKERVKPRGEKHESGYYADALKHAREYYSRSNPGASAGVGAHADAVAGEARRSPARGRERARERERERDRDGNRPQDRDRDRDRGRGRGRDRDRTRRG